METVKLWKVSNEDLKSIKKQTLDKEEKIESWLEKDISILSPKYFVIGRQVLTDHGKEIDLLLMDNEGNLIVCELKRDLTPREVTAQILDYGSWVKDLNYEEINDITVEYLNKKNITNINNIEELYAEKFPNNDVPDEFNTHHKLIIVASNIDESTSRIIKYLNGYYAVDINCITFNFFKDNNDEFIAMTSIIEDDEISSAKKTKTGRAESLIKQLFTNNLINVGDTAIFIAAVDRGVDKNDESIQARIINNTTRCLKRENDPNIYSFSSLRKVIINEKKFSDLRPNWGFGAKTEWGIKKENENIPLYKLGENLI